MKKGNIGVLAAVGGLSRLLGHATREAFLDSSMAIKTASEIIE